eukprot:COSAG02_NODE_13_length_57813_cov_14.298276_23_plen_182_part_00
MAAPRACSSACCCRVMSCQGAACTANLGLLTSFSCVRVQAAIGWWCFIDAAIYNMKDTTIAACPDPHKPKDLTFAMWLPGIGATLGVVMINCFNYSAYTNTGDGGSAAACNNAWLFFSYLIMFGCIIASTWIMVEYWLAGDSCTNWPGIASVVQTVCLLISATVFFIGRENGSKRPQMGGF